jgi:hypothetical protein
VRRAEQGNRNIQSEPAFIRHYNGYKISTEENMVRILPALVGAVTLGAAAVLRRKKRNALKNSQSRSRRVVKSGSKGRRSAKPRARHAKAAAKR